jgi:hypothetical protein
MGLLANHVIQGVVPLAMMRNDTFVRCLCVLELLLTISKNAVVRSSVAANEANIVVPNVLASNGALTRSCWPHDDSDNKCCEN